MAVRLEKPGTEPAGFNPEAGAISNTVKDTQDLDTKDSGDAVVKELEIFNHPLSGIPARKYLRIGSLLTLESLLTGSQMVGTFVVNGAGHILLNAYASTSDQAAMGLALVFHLWFYYGMLISVYEKFGIDWSRSFGAKQYHLTKVYLYQAAVVLFTTFALITLPAFWFGERILVAVGTEPTLAATTARVLRPFALASAIASAETLLKSFSMAQGHEAVFGNTVVFSIVPAVGAAYWLVKHCGYGVTGWIYSKVIYEALNLVTSVVVLLLRAHPETWGKVSLAPVLSGLGKYFVDSFKYALGSYTEYLGYLFGFYFVILTHDENQIAAFTIIQTVGGFVYTVGEAFATIMRTRMNILIGKKLNSHAKTFMIFFYFLMAAVSVLFMGLLFLFRENIARIHAGSSERLCNCFRSLFLVQILFTPCHLTLPCTGIGLKTIGMVNKMVVWSFQWYLLVSGTVYILLFLLGWMNSVVAFSVVGVAANIITVMSLHKTCSTDWTLIQLQTEEDEIYCDLASPALEKKPLLI